MDVTLIAAIIALTGTLIVLTAQQFLEFRRQDQSAREARNLRLREDRRLLYRDVVELSYSIINTFNRAANWSFVSEIAAERNVQLADEVQEKAEAEAGRLTSEINSRIDILQARTREVQILGGGEPSRAALAIHSSILQLWNAYPTARGRPVTRRDVGDLLDTAELKIRDFVAEIEPQIRL